MYHSQLLRECVLDPTHKWERLDGLAHANSTESPCLTHSALRNDDKNVLYSPFYTCLR